MFSKKNKPFQSEQQAVNNVNKKYAVNKKIGLFAFFALTASMVMTIYEYASFASAGWALILFLFIGGLCWFIPVAIMSAEMATVKGWTDGGLYTWVKRTVGIKWGFAAIFFQWFQITIGFVTMLLFIVTMITFSFGGVSGLATTTGVSIDVVNQASFGNASTQLTWEIVGITFAIVVLFFIIITVSQLFGVKYTSLISRIGFVGGVIVPFALLFIFGIIFISQHGLNNSMDSFTPSSGQTDNAMIAISQLVIFVSFILSYLGVEASASQIKNLKNPKKNYPKVMIILVCLAIGFSSIAGVFIAIATKVGNSSSTQLSFTAGIIQAFLIMTSNSMGTEAAISFTRFISFLMGAAVIAQISSWVVGPSKAMQVAAENGLLPKMFSKANKYDVPVNMIILQSLSVILWCTVIIFGLIGGIGVGAASADNGSNTGFLGAMQLTVIIYLLAYFLLILAYIVYAKNPKKYPSEFTLLKYKWLKLSFAILGLVTNAFAFVIAFFPQSSGDYGLYYGIIFGLSIPSAILPFAIFWIMNRKNKIVDTDNTIVETNSATNLKPISNQNLNKNQINQMNKNSNDLDIKNILK